MCTIGVLVVSNWLFLFLLHQQKIIFLLQLANSLIVNPYPQICYFFYKNITFGMTIFYYEACSKFSGQIHYNDWYMSLFNVFFTSIPVMALGILEQDVSANTCLEVGKYTSICYNPYISLESKSSLTPIIVIFIFYNSLLINTEYVNNLKHQASGLVVEVCHCHQMVQV